MLKKTDNLKPLCLLVATLFCVPQQTSAQEIVTCTSGNSDTDGDGWGWEDNASCLVSVGNDLTCVDTDGDGWGWDGVKSCLITASEETTELPVTEAAACIDTDGDGWGWNGVSSCLALIGETTTDETVACVDSDGDGYGWDGTKTCNITSIANTTGPTNEMPVQDIPYMEHYETYTNSTWPVITSAEAMWPPVGDAVEATNGWTRTHNHPLIHLVLCEDPDSAMEDPANPGYFYDAAKGQTCAKTDTVAIPAPGNPVEFTYIGSEVLYENGNQWECRHESRPSMDTEFQADGRTRTVTYESGSGINFTWYPYYPLLPHNLSYKNNTLTWYYSGVLRETCDRVMDENYPLTVYGEAKAELYRKMLNAFVGDSTPLAMRSNGYPPESNLEIIPMDSFVSRPLRCARLSSTKRFFRGGGETYYFSELEREVTIETIGDNEYDITGFEELPYGVPGMTFYSYTQDQSILFTIWIGPAGSSVQTTRDIYACEAIDSLAE